MNLYLIGYRGSGKSTVARLLGQRLAWPWVDADEVLERQTGKTIREIFAESGEDRFRDLESAVLQSLASRTGHVVALGGGVVLRDTNRRVMAASGRAVWLWASPQTLWTRMQEDPATGQRRPNLAGGGLAEVEQLLAVRTPLYEACADLVVDAENAQPQQLADQIAAWWRNECGLGSTPQAGGTPGPERL
jgi:shikimate kinase